MPTAVKLPNLSDAFLAIVMPRQINTIYQHITHIDTIAPPSSAITAKI